MSQQDVIDHVISPMQRIWNPPRSKMGEEEQKGALEIYIGALAGFEASDLKSAFQSAVGSHTTHSWPMPAVFVMAASKARRDRTGEVAGVSQATGTKSEKAPGWMIWANAKRSDKAQYAIERGIAWAFKHQIVNCNVAIDDVDLADLELARDRAAETFGKIENFEPLHAKDGRAIGVMDGVLRDRAINTYRQMLVLNAQTEIEIGNSR